MTKPLACSSMIAVMVFTLLNVGCAPPADNSGSGQSSGGGAAANGGGGSTGGAAKSGPKAYKMSELSVGLGPYLPPVDQGRLELAQPENWHRGSRKNDYVARFHAFKDQRLLPDIRVTAEDAPADAPQNATPENVEEYAKWVATDVEGKLGENETLAEKVVPLVLGENAFGRYVRKGMKGVTQVERQILTTTHNGRVYHIELIVLPEDLRESRDAGYVVGAGMKFIDDGSGDLTPGGNDEPGEESP